MSAVAVPSPGDPTVIPCPDCGSRLMLRLLHANGSATLDLHGWHIDARARAVGMPWLVPTMTLKKQADGTKALKHRVRGLAAKRDQVILRDGLARPDYWVSVQEAPNGELSTTIIPNKHSVEYQIAHGLCQDVRMACPRCRDFYTLDLSCWRWQS